MQTEVCYQSTSVCLREYDLKNKVCKTGYWCYILCKIVGREREGILITDFY